MFREPIAASGGRTAAITRKRGQLFDSDEDDEDSSTDSLPLKRVPPTNISRSPEGNTRRGGRGAQLLRVPVEGSSGSPATNTRGQRKGKFSG